MAYEIMPDSNELKMFKDGKLFTGQHSVFHEPFQETTVSTYLDGMLHSFDDKPSMMDYEGDDLRRNHWHKNGKLHRENNPAYVRYTNEGGRVQIWYIHGWRHRTNGPAVTNTSLTHGLDIRWNEWWINGKNVTDDIDIWAKEVGIDLNNITPDDEIMILLKFGG